MDKPGVLVGRTVTVRPREPEPDYFTDVHRRWRGCSGRVHAIVATQDRNDPLVKVGFGEPKQIVFYWLADLEVRADEAPRNPAKHGRRASHLPDAG